LRSANVTSADEAVDHATEIGLPVALKAAGPTIVHKSDVGGVRLDLATSDAVRHAYEDMHAQLGSAMTGALVQRMADPGVETIIGVVLDPLFGPLVMFGLGGIATELLR